MCLASYLAFSKIGQFLFRQKFIILSSEEGMKARLIVPGGAEAVDARGRHRHKCGGINHGRGYECHYCLNCCYGVG